VLSGGGWLKLSFALSITLVLSGGGWLKQSFALSITLVLSGGGWLKQSFALSITLVLSGGWLKRSPSRFTPRTALCCSCNCSYVFALFCCSVIGITWILNKPWNMPTFLKPDYISSLLFYLTSGFFKPSFSPNICFQMDYTDTL
jgi:hypothetical protein